MTTDNSNAPAPPRWEPWGSQQSRDAYLDWFTSGGESLDASVSSYWAGHVVAIIPALSPAAQALRPFLSDADCFRLDRSENGGALVRAFALAPGVVIGELAPGEDLEIVIDGARP